MNSKHPFYTKYCPEKQARMQYILGQEPGTLSEELLAEGREIRSYLLDLTWEHIDEISNWPLCKYGYGLNTKYLLTTLWGYPKDLCNTK